VERRSFLKNAGVGLAAGSVAMPAIAQNAPTIKWRLASSFPKSLDTIYGGAEYMAKRVAEATGGKFQIQVFAGGEIVPGPAVFDAVKDDTVEMGHTVSYYFFGKDPTYAFETAIPFGMTNRQIDAWMRYGNGTKLMGEFFAKSNIVIHSLRQHRYANGRLVPQGNQDGCRSQGPEDPYRRLCRRGAQQARRRAAADSGWRHLSLAGEGHDRRRRMDRSVR
jgi:hypothetical protein